MTVAGFEESEAACHPLRFDPSTRSLRPVAARVGPFAGPHFLNTIWRHTAGPGDIPIVLSDQHGAVALATDTSGCVGLPGHEDLVDYRSPVGEVTGLLENHFRSWAGLGRFRFDSLPAAAADMFTAALTQAGIEHRRSLHTNTAVLPLPGSFDEYLGVIGKKERHETRRKRRRFERSLGPPRLVGFTQPGPVLEEFFRLHRLSHGDKGRFMTDRMAALFNDLLTGEGWRLEALYGDESRLVAAAVAYEDATGYYLYNSAYDPGFRQVSPGVVLLSELIRSAIEAENEVFDFLKGDETYKFRLGARRRPLFVIESAI